MSRHCECRQGDKETRRQGDKETRRQGEKCRWPCRREVHEASSPCLLVSLSPCLLVSLSPCLLVSLSPCLLVLFEGCRLCHLCASATAVASGATVLTRPSRWPKRAACTISPSNTSPS